MKTDLQRILTWNKGSRISSVLEIPERRRENSTRLSPISIVVGLDDDQSPWAIETTSGVVLSDLSVTNFVCSMTEDLTLLGWQCHYTPYDH